MPQEERAPTFGVRRAIPRKHVGVLQLGDVEQTDAESHVVHDLCATAYTHTVTPKPSSQAVSLETYHLRAGRITPLHGGK